MDAIRLKFGIGTIIKTGGKGPEIDSEGTVSTKADGKEKLGACFIYAQIPWKPWETLDGELSIREISPPFSGSDRREQKYAFGITLFPRPSRSNLATNTFTPVRGLFAKGNGKWIKYRGHVQPVFFRPSFGHLEQISGHRQGRYHPLFFHMIFPLLRNSDQLFSGWNEINRIALIN